MAYLTPVASNDDVPQLELNTPALGGPGGPMNSQAQALLNSITFHKDSETAHPDIRSDIESKGDMFKSVYDADNDGKVNSAESADSVPYTGITGLPTSFAPSAHASSHSSAGSDPLSIIAGQVSGLAAVATSGSYNDLIDAPTVSGESNTASNVGTSGEGVFKQKTGVDLEFKKIKAGTNITLVSTLSDEIEISAAGSVGEANTASNTGTGEGVFAQKNGSDLQFKSIVAGSNITIGSSATEVTISAASSAGGTVTHGTGNLTINEIVVGNGTDDVKPLGTLGTTSTVLHGNAAGLPTFGAVALSTDVSGVLPVTSGGSGVDTISGILMGNGTSAFTAAVAGIDYLSPSDVGTTVQAYDADLTTWGGKTAPTGAVVGTTDTQTLTNKTLVGYTETVYSLTGTTPALSPANGTVQTWTLTSASTPTDSMSDGQSIILGITAGSYSITWPSVTWVKVGGSGVAPTLTSTGVNWIVLWKVGSAIRGSFLGTA